MSGSNNNLKTVQRLTPAVLTKAFRDHLFPSGPLRRTSDCFVGTFGGTKSGNQKGCQKIQDLTFPKP